MIFDSHDYPAEQVRKGSVIKLGERAHQESKRPIRTRAIRSQNGLIGVQIVFDNYPHLSS